MADPAREFLGQLAESHAVEELIIGASGGGPMIRGNGQAYRGGQLTRLWRDWVPWHRSGDAAIAENWSLLTSRIRDLCRNDGVMKSIKRALAKHVIGSGILSFSDVMDGEEPDDNFNFEADAFFEYWAEHEADAEGKFSWYEMQWQAFNEVPETGEVFFLKCVDNSPKRTLPFCLQLLEPEQLDTRYDQPATNGQNKIVRGIEYDKRGRPVAYYIYDAHPYDLYSSWTGGSKRVPADRVIHLFLPGRPSENRGVTWFAANVQSAKDLDWYLGNELTAAAIGALLTLIIKRKYGAGSGLGFSGDGTSSESNADDYGNPIVKLGRGIVCDIGAEDDVKVAESGRPNRDAQPFVKLMLMLQGMAAGVSQLRVTGDYSQSSYTSARGAHLDDQAYFVVLQNWFARKAVLPAHRDVITEAAAYGKFRSVGARQFAKQQAKFLRLQAQPPGREQLDPEKETGAAMARIRAGFSTWRDECGLRGRDWRRIVLQQKRERAFMERHGFEPDLSDSARLQTDTASAVSPQPGDEPGPAPSKQSEAF